MSTPTTEVLDLDTPVTGITAFGFPIRGKIVGRSWFFDRLEGYLVRGRIDGVWETYPVSADRIQVVG